MAYPDSSTLEPTVTTEPTESREGVDRGSIYYESGPDDRQISIALKSLKLGTDLHEIQQEVLYTKERQILVAGGERAGKSFVSSVFLATRVPFGKLFWIVADNYELARPEFNYTIEFLQTVGAFASQRDISVPKVGKASARLKTGQYIETKTADDVRKLAAVAPDGILMVEAAQQPYEAYLRSVGRVAETRGWVFLSGTFEGSLGWYVELWNEWQDPQNRTGGKSFSMPTWSNTIVYPGGRDDPEIKRMEAIYSRVPGLFEERLGAVPVPPAFLVFRDFRHGIHVNENVKFNRQLPVYLAVDPSSGTNPYSVLACQFEEDVTPHPDNIDFCNVIDEIYVTGEQAEEIIARCVTKAWWKHVRGGAIDVEDPDERKRWKRFGGVTLQAKKIEQLAGIRRLKSFLYFKQKDGEVIQPPHLRIAPGVRGLTYEFGVYKRKQAVNTDREPKEIPPSDQPNHSVKALWYLLYHRYGDVKRIRKYGVTKTWSRPNRRSSTQKSL